MTRLLVDTSAYSAFMRGHEAVKQALQRADAIYVNPIILGELLAGFQRGRHRENNEEVLGQFLASPRVSVVTVDEDTAERYAVILNGLKTAGTPIPTNDMWIAATAMQHGLPVLTTDAHYLKVQQILVHEFPSG
jgi:tRNA(fMet)-specific endonuclease VapC